MRFLAAFGVLLYHYVSGYLRAYAPDDGLRESIAAVARYGYLGVNGFFMISGFVILWSALQRDAASFVVGRISRLYPCFWVSVLLTALVVFAFAEHAPRSVADHLSPSMVVANLTMIPGLLGFPYVDDVYWTLEIELRFYALVFIMLSARQQHRVDLLLQGWVATLVAARFVDLPWIISFISIDPWGSYFVAGCYFFLVHTRGWTAGRAIGLSSAAVLCIWQAMQGRGDFITPDSASSLVVPAIVASLFGFFAFLVHRGGKRAWAGVAERLGSLTYSLYLTHACIGFVAIGMLVPHVGPTWSMIVVTFGAIVLALLLTRFVDEPARKPFAAWLSRIVHRPMVGRG